MYVLFRRAMLSTERGIFSSSAAERALTLECVRAASIKAASPPPMLRPIVLSGPSGGGKSTVLKKAMDQHPNVFGFSVSHTTRQPRPGEENGVHYWFSTKEEIQKMIINGDFLEHASFGGNTYGTSKKAVEDVVGSGKICVLDVDLQGVRNIKQSHLSAKYILIRAPTVDILEERLRARGTETEDSLKKRLQHAREDMEAVDADPSLFDYVIINDDLYSAYRQFINAISEDINAVERKGA